MTKEEYVSTKSATARELFLQGYNCTQSVVLAFKEELGIEPQILQTLSLGLGGGVGRLREVCGAVSACAMLSGIFVDHSSSHAEQKTTSYAVVQEIAAEFKAQAGSIICRELLGLGADAATTGGDCRGDAFSPTPEERTADYYSRRPCPDKIALAAGLFAARLWNEKGNSIDYSGSTL